MGKEDAVRVGVLEKALSAVRGDLKRHRLAVVFVAESVVDGRTSMVTNVCDGFGVIGVLSGVIGTVARSLDSGVRVHGVDEPAPAPDEVQ